MAAAVGAVAQATVSHAETHGPAWAVRARNTGGSRRPVNKRHRTARKGSGGRSRTMRRLAQAPQPGVMQGITGGGPGYLGWRPIHPCSQPKTVLGVGGRLGGEIEIQELP